jgi:hypothetical protein
MNGIYVAYMTGRAGTSVLMLVISGGMIVGADVGGIQYDFAIKENPDGSGYHCSGVYVVPAGTILITGAPPAVGPQRIVIEFDLPKVLRCLAEAQPLAAALRVRVGGRRLPVGAHGRERRTSRDLRSIDPRGRRVRHRRVRQEIRRQIREGGRLPDQG